MIDDLLAGWAELEASHDQYEEAEAYYEGKTEEWFSSARIRQAVAATGARYRFNLAKTPVNVMADRVELSAVTVPDDGTASQLIEAVWDANDLDVHYPDLFQKMFTYGDAYLQVWPVLEADETLDGELFIAGVELTVHGPKHCRVIYDPENARRKAYVIKRWPVKVGGRERWRTDLYYRDVIERWISLPGAQLSEDTSWVPFLEDGESDDDWTIPNEFGEIPFFHYRNALPYGVPEHVAGYGCQDAVNKMLITQLTTTDSHGWPQRYSLTDNALDDAHTQDWLDAEPGGLVGDSVAADPAAPGSILDFVGKKAVGQFDAAQPNVFLQPAELYIRLMAQLTTTPLHYFDPSGDAPSGESLRVAEAPLVKKIQNRQVMLRGAVQETWGFVLRLLNRDVPRVDVRWAPPASASGTSDWQTVKAKQDAGVPQQQSLVEAGFEAEVVARWFDETPEGMDLTKKLDLLSKLSETIPNLQAAVEAGLLPAESAASVIGQMLNQVAPPPGTDLTA